MKALAATAGLTAMVLSLSVPALLLAQEPVSEPPAAAEGEAATAVQSQPEAVAAPDESTSAKASGSVDMIDYKFVPKTVTISAGDTVTWNNTGEEDHDADGNGFSSGTVEPGEDASARFANAGTFKYICTFHPDMKGTVVVKDDGDDGAGGVGDDGGSGGTTDPTTGASTTDTSSSTFGSSESSSSLPETGENEIPLIIVGAAFLVCGLLVGALWRHQAGP